MADPQENRRTEDPSANENPEVEAEKEAEDAKPAVGTDPMRTPGEGGHKQVAPDPEKVKEHEQEE